MGFELDAFVGRAEELRQWKAELPGVAVCPLGGELALVPITGELAQQMRARLAQKEADSSGREALPSGKSSNDSEAGVFAWGACASEKTTLAYVSLSEFGDDSREEVFLWHNGEIALSNTNLSVMRRYFQEKAGFDTNGQAMDLEKYRGETAAEKWAAAAIFEELTGHSESPIPSLLAALRYVCGNPLLQNLVRASAASALGKQGTAAKETLPALAALLQNETDSALFSSVVHVMAAIGLESAPFLANALSGAVYEKQWPLLRALGELGSAAGQAVPTLIKTLQKPVRYDYLGVRREAAETLGRIGTEARAAIPALTAALQDNNETVRSAAARALGAIGDNSRRVISALDRAKQDDNRWVRQAAEQALERLQNRLSSS